METIGRGLLVSRFGVKGWSLGSRSSIYALLLFIIVTHPLFSPRSLFHSRIYCAGLMPTEKVKNSYTRHTKYLYTAYQNALACSCLSLLHDFPIQGS